MKVYRYGPKDAFRCKRWPQHISTIWQLLWGALVGTKELIITCCAYGNSFTLPSVFMMSLLSADAFQRATGYTALFLMTWSPMLWGYGYKILASAAGPRQGCFPRS